MPYSKVFIEHNPVNDISALRKKVHGKLGKGSAAGRGSVKIH